MSTLAARAGLAASNLACTRGDRAVFAGLSFVVPTGRVLVVRGANGAGKTSLLRIIAGIVGPTDGQLTWQGTDVGTLAEAYRAHVSYVAHLDAIKPALTVAENLVHWAKLRAGTGTVAAALSALGIERLAELPARFLSAGQRRRVALARLLVVDAPLWVLDEPTVSLDDAGVDLLGRAMEGHLGRGGLIVATTHVDLPVAAVDRLDLTPPSDGGEHAPLF
ncbi:MAG: heme ABC exporter ATP-binding protein CcmA [Alphaproteobacteria bacterium]|nr:heme ABC exporter ATP-binding protein CcmA [Alphaproteobacteria bacterium]